MIMKKISLCVLVGFFAVINMNASVSSAVSSQVGSTAQKALKGIESTVNAAQLPAIKDVVLKYIKAHRVMCAGLAVFSILFVYLMYHNRPATQEQYEQASEEWIQEQLHPTIHHPLFADEMPVEPQQESTANEQQSQQNVQEQNSLTAQEAEFNEAYFNGLSTSLAL